MILAAIGSGGLCGSLRECAFDCGKRLINIEWVLKVIDLTYLSYVSDNFGNTTHLAACYVT